MASLRDLDRNVLEGIILPRKPGKGRWPQELRDEWLDITEILLGRGVDSMRRMSRLTLITPKACGSLMDEVKKRWAEGVTSKELNWRREQLFREADEVARQAWDGVAEARDDGNIKAQGDMLRIVLAANSRKSKLIGADTAVVQIRASIEAKVGIDLIAQVEADYGLVAGGLEKLGKAASQMFSEASRARITAEEQEAIDVDFAVEEVVDQVPARRGTALGALLAQLDD